MCREVGGHDAVPTRTVTPKVGLAPAKRGYLVSTHALTLPSRARMIPPGSWPVASEAFSIDRLAWRLERPDLATRDVPDENSAEVPRPRLDVPRTGLGAHARRPNDLYCS
jgi:hypothetical protein